jgi:hypothetical protein
MQLLIFICAFIASVAMAAPTELTGLDILDEKEVLSL